ncbi:MAG TPA: F0F1 ATP synthase subunit epsilon [Trueperaceae bacterium]|nr:F0F1 ATP synthase subunit epsilon [Trueperaceae bacterium]
MRLLLSVPTGVLVDEAVTKVSAESDRGSFTMLPRHADGAVLLVPGLLSYVTAAGEEVFVAVDEGVMVKAGPEVRAACRRAVVAGALESAEAALAERLRSQDEHEKRAKAALLRLEAEVLRRLGGV